MPWPLEEWSEEEKEKAYFQCWDHYKPKFVVETAVLKAVLGLGILAHA